MTSITAVIVHYHEEPAQLRAAIDSLLAQTRPPAEILILDNERSGALAATLAGYGPQVRAIDCGSNRGYVAINLAAAQASGDHLLCLNPDARAHEDCLALLAEQADADPSVALVGAQILLEDGVTRNAGANPLHPTGISPAGGYGEPREHGEPREAIVVSGACFLARREAFLAIGGFVEDFFLYYEDVDLCWRTWIAGARVLYCPAAVVLPRLRVRRVARQVVPAGAQPPVGGVRELRAADARAARAAAGTDRARAARHRRRGRLASPEAARVRLALRPPWAAGRHRRAVQAIAAAPRPRAPWPLRRPFGLESAAAAGRDARERRVRAVPLRAPPPAALRTAADRTVRWDGARR